MAGVTGDFGKLQGAINALNKLSRVPSQVATVAAPKLTEQLHKDAHAERNPYGRGFEAHAPATIKRWGAHKILDLTGAGIESLEARPAAGAGITITADEHMRFSQGGTVNEPVRATLPNNPTLPKTWNEILSDARDQVLEKALEVAK